MTERYPHVKALSSNRSTRHFRWTIVVVSLTGMLVLSALLSLFIGERSFGLLDVIDIIRGVAPETSREIFTVQRLPRMILAFAAGGGLSLAGVILQGIYRNPLVSPYTLGVSGGAALGATIIMALGLHHVIGSMILPLAGFSGSILAIAFIYILSFRGGKTHIQSMLLVGVMFSFIASSSMMFLKTLATKDSLHTIVFWMMGSLDESDMSMIYLVLAVATAVLLVSMVFAGPLNALRLGQEKAGHLGINTELTIRILFVLASLLIGVTVSVAGVIGFVGLVVPHIIRVMVGSDYRILLVTSFMGGGIFLLLSDIAARVMILPIGVITGIVGGTVFIFVLTRRNMKTL